MKQNSSSMTWDVPPIVGQPPPPRESHSCCGYTEKDGRRPRLLIYGGMSGCRLGDLWQLEIGTLLFIVQTKVQMYKILGHSQYHLLQYFLV